VWLLIESVPCKIQGVIATTETMPVSRMAGETPKTLA